VRWCDSGGVARPGHTDRTLFRKTLELVPEAKILGVILSDNQEWFLWKTPSPITKVISPASSDFLHFGDCDFQKHPQSLQ
jgi:hypothetical protein